MVFLLEMRKMIVRLFSNKSQVYKFLPTLRLSDNSFKPPSCNDCIFSISDKDFSNNSCSNKLKCTKFIDETQNNGKVNYQYAFKCRSDENKCGKNGRYFIPINAYY